MRELFMGIAVNKMSIVGDLLSELIPKYLNIKIIFLTFSQG